MESEDRSSASATSEPNYIVQLFRGDVPLPVTYWIFGVAISILLQIPVRVIESHYLDIISVPLGAQMIAAYYWFILGYGLFIFIAIWRSAGKFQGNKFWSVLARIIVGFNVIALAGNLYTRFEERDDPSTRIAEEIRLINRSLPRMVDNDLRLDRISIFDGSVRYSYTLVNVEAIDVDIPRLQNALTPVIKLNTCQDKGMRAILDDDMDVTFAYHDKMSNAVISITVSKEDCI